MSHRDSDDLVRRALRGERVPLARAISLVENEAPEAVAILDAAFAGSGAAFRIGITGPPGAGKSTLVTRLAQEYRRRGDTVAIVAVNPTSPFTGGALLGDRVRMGELSGDEGVFIRSMATRGSMGGLAVHTAQVCDVLDAAHFSRILIETVGVGQSELEVAQTADSTAVVLVPESGDGVQAMKAGLMEIGDLFVVNKADREGAERAAFAVKAALELRSAGDRCRWCRSPPPRRGGCPRGGRRRRGASPSTCSATRSERRRRARPSSLNDLLRQRLWRFRARAAMPVGNEYRRYDGHRLTPHQGGTPAPGTGGTLEERNRRPAPP
jgi:LAO/AO transport system ATPase